MQVRRVSQHQLELQKIEQPQISNLNNFKPPLSEVTLDPVWHFFDTFIPLRLLNQIFSAEFSAQIVLFLHSFQLDNSFKSCLQGVLKMVIFSSLHSPCQIRLMGPNFLSLIHFCSQQEQKKILTACSIPRFSILPLSEETSFPNDKSLLEVCATPILIMGSVMGLSK